MVTLAVAYSLVWAAVAVYVGWLGIRQGRMARDLLRLQSEAERAGRAEPQASRAA